MDNVMLYTKLSTLPENLKIEVSNFIDKLMNKAKMDKNTPGTPTPKFGSAKGMFKMSGDFDEPLEDFKDYMNP